MKISVFKKSFTGKDSGGRLAREMGANLLYETSPLPELMKREKHVIINYGRPFIPDRLISKKRTIILNNPSCVPSSSSKRLTFLHLQEAGVPHLSFTASKKEAAQWNKNSPIIARHLAGSSGGKGIEMILPGSTVPAAALYTLWYDKDLEFRIFVVDGKVVQIVEKKRMSKEKREELYIDECDELIRTHGRGWVFAHYDLSLDTASLEAVGNIGKAAIEAVGLDWGSVDVLVKTKKNKEREADSIVVCEINSSPGLKDPITLRLMSQAFLDYCFKMNK